jgi:hypothetical protein
MPRFLLDASLAENLRSASDVVEIVDEAGRVLGVYTPVLKHVPPPGFKFPISDEELKRRRQEKTGRSLNEILEDLKQKHGE